MSNQHNSQNSLHIVQHSDHHSDHENDQVVNLALYSLERLSASVDAEDLDFSDQKSIDLLISQKQNWEIYHLIGDVMRNPDLALKPSTNLAMQIAQRVDQEPLLVMSSPQQVYAKPALSKWQRYWPTLAMAAAVASVVWVARPVIEQMQGVQTAPQYTRANNDVLSASAKLNAYVRAHRDLSGPAVVQVRSSVDGAIK
jgi:sigma-E factor negative regulatory protein RseA